MIKVFSDWYKRKFSDPDAATLLVLILISAIALAVWGNMLAPVLVAVVMAYLLDWPVERMSRIGFSRPVATSFIVTLFVGICILMLLVLVPVMVNQGTDLLKELPQIWAQTQQWVMMLPERYPGLIDGNQLQQMWQSANDKIVTVGQDLITASFTNLVNIAAILIYLILVPLMIFFMLKDKHELLSNVSRILPKERRLIKQVGAEMNVQIVNYIRGKVIEIIIIGTATTVAFVVMDLRYAVLLGVLVGFSVLIPYIGAAVVTIPVAVVALFQWGLTPDFWYLMIVYSILQALDGNLLVPLLFSEAVSLHPVYIIIAVLFFGGLWGFWGVFFAIPLATLVKAVGNAWSEQSAQLQEEK
ncbi:AI-2E family transporter [Neptunicella marina]|uniref:AI-2E family transporter n=1 Tax=Neptunicella marina TaxID=2125989 RepID=A0A8J6IW43_9ALTE|nr:AI-2E family transporter [Neptunicella marina]MBC3767354.1 AI-2E family transporter [Neptunicella marina]